LPFPFAGALGRASVVKRDCEGKSMSHMIGMILARQTIRRAGLVPQLSPDRTRLQAWRDGLEKGVIVGSVLVDWQGDQGFVSRHGLARALYGRD
jgi:hypothetical protein